jgi:RNA-binding protein 39
LKKKRYDDMDESSAGLPPKDSPRRGHDRRDRSRERRYRDPRDEFDDPPRFRRERDHAHDKRPPIDDTPLIEEEPDKGSSKMSPPPIKYAPFMLLWLVTHNIQTTLTYLRGPRRLQSRRT